MDNNEEVLTQLGYSFNEAMDKGDIEECRSIISHTKDIDVLSAKVLEAQLLEAPLSNFTHQSDETLWS